MSISSDISIVDTDTVSLPRDNLDINEFDYNEEEDSISDEYTTHPFPDEVTHHFI